MIYCIMFLLMFLCLNIKVKMWWWWPLHPELENRVFSWPFVLPKKAPLAMAPVFSKKLKKEAHPIPNSMFRCFVFSFLLVWKVCLATLCCWYLSIRHLKTMKQEQLYPAWPSWPTCIIFKLVHGLHLSTYPYLWYIYISISLLLHSTDLYVYVFIYIYVYM